jgi:hypothetical protein
MVLTGLYLAHIDTAAGTKLNFLLDPVTRFADSIVPIDRSQEPLHYF